jgi:hypothetical protein
MHDTMFRALTVLQDGGQWLGIAALGCTVGALRRRVRALEARTGISTPRAEWEALPPHIRNEAALEMTGQR